MNNVKDAYHLLESDSDLILNWNCCWHYNILNFLFFYILFFHPSYKQRLHMYWTIASRILDCGFHDHCHFCQTTDKLFSIICAVLSL